MPSTLERASARPIENTEVAERSDQLLVLKHEQIKDQYRGYFEETLNGIRVAGKEETEQLQEWVDNTQATKEDIHALREFWDLQIQKQLQSGRALREQFDRTMQSAVEKKITSTKWTKRWTEKFEEKNANYKQREYWVNEQLPEHIRTWERITDQRKKLIKKPDFQLILDSNPRYQILTQEQEALFLDLPIHQQEDLIFHTESAMIAEKKSMKDLHNSARKMLDEQVQKGVLSKDKIGTWLRRIFIPKCTPRSVTKILTEKGAGTLDDLIQNWTMIRIRFDACTEKFERLDEKRKPRGLQLLSEKKFLAMHYREREVYVRDLETRLTDAEEVEKEHPKILYIRHIMDSGEWEEAMEEIMSLKQDTTLSEHDHDRLEKMEMRAQLLVDRNKKNREKERTGEGAIEEIDAYMKVLERECPEEKDKVLALLESPHPNRGIANFYWISYNHIWCRDHFYLNDDIAKKGAEKIQVQETREKVEHGEDTGMHDAISNQTADGHYFRKQEFAEQEATYQHMDASSQKAQKAHVNWLNNEHSYKEMYWTNYCAHSEGKPKSEGWHRNLTNILRKLRSATRTLESSGMRYESKWKRGSK
jgi:hypothetical protein